MARAQRGIIDHYTDAMSYVQNTYGKSDPQLNAYMQRQLQNCAYEAQYGLAAYYNKSSPMLNMSIDEQQDYIKYQISNIQRDYSYNYQRYEGPTQRELDENPSLKDAWEQYIIIKELSK